MDISNIDNLQDIENLTIMFSTEYLIKDAIKYSFKNVLEISSEINEEEINKIIKVINKKVKKLIIFNFNDIYRRMLPFFSKNVKIKCIYSYNLSKMTDWNIRTIYYNILEFYDRNIITEIGCLDYDTYIVLKNSGYKVKYVLLDVENCNVINNNSKTIGIIGNDYDPNHNIYNLLGATKLIECDGVKIVEHMPATKKFIDFFNIKGYIVNNLEDVIKNNYINLYVNYTDTIYTIVLKSMDMHIPCLLGNTDIYNNYSILKKYLIVDSDDDINEISKKIKDLLDKDNLSLIWEEYRKFREEYIDSSKKSIMEFLE